MARKPFKPRILVAFLMVLGFLTGAGSGVVLYATPRGRIANWTGWSFLDLARDDWMNIHVVTGLMFLIAGLFHLWFNWKPLKAFIWQRAAQSLNRGWEMLIAAALTLFVVVGAVRVLPPIDQILALREWAKEGMVGPVAPAVNRPPSPADPVHAGAGSGGGGGGAGGGFGRMTIRDVADQAGLDYDSVRTRLAARGIIFADQESVRDIAARYGMRPGELGRMVQQP